MKFQEGPLGVLNSFGDPIPPWEYDKVSGPPSQTPKRPPLRPRDLSDLWRRKHDLSQQEGNKRNLSSKPPFLALPKHKALFYWICFQMFKRPLLPSGQDVLPSTPASWNGSPAGLWLNWRGPLILVQEERHAAGHAKGKEGLGLPSARLWPPEGALTPDFRVQRPLPVLWFSECLRDNPWRV